MNRWLTPDDCTGYIGVRVHQLPRLVKLGKLPEPSRHLGPRSPRWDRDELDSRLDNNEGEQRVMHAKMANCRLELGNGGGE